MDILFSNSQCLILFKHNMYTSVEPRENRTRKNYEIRRVFLKQEPSCTIKRKGVGEDLHPSYELNPYCEIAGVRNKQGRKIGDNKKLEITEFEPLESNTCTERDKITTLIWLTLTFSLYDLPMILFGLCFYPSW